VVLGLADEWAVHEAADDGRPVLVQPMIRGGVELLAGVVQDPVFGPARGIRSGRGAGGADRRGGVPDRAAYRRRREAMVAAGKAGRLVAGFRGAPPADAVALRDVLTRLWALAVDLPELAELDLNPVIETADGCVIVDARARVAPSRARGYAKTG
jgi:acetate---CoA ligase (ADP-forming)